MLCSEFLLVKDGDGYQDVKPLPCDRWTCPYCSPRRRRALIAQAVAGEPNKILTLTCSINAGESPSQRRGMLHNAWKLLVKRIIRQFAKPPGQRWPLVKTKRDPLRSQRIARIDAKTAPGALTALPYMAFIEKTKRGEPHLHILLRCPFIPQDWISEQMFGLLGSPIVWIEQVKGTAKAIAYVTKYVGKAPAQFGTAKRYWVSRNWLVNAPTEPERQTFDMRGVRVERVRWSEYAQTKTCNRYWRQPIEDGWVRFWKPGTFGSEGGEVPQHDTP